MEYKIRIIILLFLCTLVFATPLSKNSIAYKIYKNECNAKIENLLHWNKGENFPSLGIGHFIWYPKGVDEKFEESFPEFIKYLEQKSTKLPTWLNNTTNAPWKDKQQMQNSPKSIEIKNLLKNTMHLQALFMQQKIKNILPKLLKSTPKNKQPHVKKMFNKLQKTTMGAYILTDYLNFKGSGTNPKERYKNQGWGLLQVLLCMEDKRDPAFSFSQCAKKILLQRVKNAPSSRGEKRWLKGWFNRINTYTK